MKLLVISLVLPALSWSAAPVTRTDIIARVTSHLLRLKLAVAADEPLKDEVYTSAELQSLATYSQNQAIRPFQTDLFDFQLANYLATKPAREAEIRLRPFITSDQAYKLGVVLTGKDLTDMNLKPLIEVLVSMLQSADDCRNTHAALQDSSDFRGSAENVKTALQRLGVEGRDLRIVINSLFRGAIAASTTPPRRVTYR